MASNGRVYISRSVVFDEKIFPSARGLFDDKKGASNSSFQSPPVLVHPSGAAGEVTNSLSVGQNASETVVSEQEHEPLPTPQSSHNTEGSEVPSAATTEAVHSESP
ncbi:hypothetical protein V6N11_003174 [Hibiscus sabdariffa]|uniref:Uncharacterized protein n=1 Tax=Hibiscus sabdariffa TaxID=183260 RepID=A0ABR2SCG3_9ROSI